MFIEAAILGIIIGIIRRGRIARLAYVEFNMAPLIYIPLILYFGIVVMNLGLFDYNSSLYSAFILGSYVLTAVFLIANIDKKFMTIPLLGLSSNLACFIVNGFHFPISTQYVAKYYGESALELLTSGKIKYFIPDEGAVLSVLGNIIPVDKVYTALIISPGDIVIAIGIALVIQGIITDRYIQTRRKITFSKKMFR